MILEPPASPNALFSTRGCALTIMAKAPKPGRVKTRLTPPLTSEQASALSICFLRDTASCIAEVALGSSAAPVVSYTPVGDEALFEGILPPEFSLVLQRGNTFGERLFFTAQDLFACGFNAVCLIDSDSPTVPKTAYEHAARALAEPGDRVVLGPSADGGYYLIGIKRPHADLFRDIAWSTSSVYAQTVERAQAGGLEVIVLPLWYDVDDGDTLSLLRAELMLGMAPGFATEPGYPALNTGSLLRNMDMIPTGAPLVGSSD